MLVKRIEEVEELIKATTKDAKAAALADVFEVVRGLATAYGVWWADIKKLADKKAVARGGFQDGRVLIETTLPRRDGPLDEVEHIRVKDLNAINVVGVEVEIPASSLMGTSIGPGVMISFYDGPSRYRVTLKNNRVRIS